ncbi:succinate dehydrogenase flavoprotein subunit [Pantoea agglomerans]
MIFDAQIVAHATAFVNALRSEQPARVPAMPFSLWPKFIRTVKSLLEVQP